MGGEFDRQQHYIEKIREINKEKQERTGRTQTFFCRTYGCQMNERDSEKLAGMLVEMGYAAASREKDADFVVYNTCCVRENAENKILGNLGRLKYYKERKPELCVALCGCMVQQENVLDVIRSKHRHVDLVFGTYNFHRLPELLYTHLSSYSRVIDIWNEHDEIVEDLPSVRKYRWKAGVNIMYGCNNFCAYCIVPYVRGRERSRKPTEILSEVERFSSDGVKEIMLLGQNVNSYGKTLEKPVSFAELLRMVHGIGGIERIRFMTSHPKDFSDALIEAIAGLPKVCKHIHLPLQSGSTKVLEKMNRLYTKEHYISLTEKIKDGLPGVSLTTDIIVGFPGETDDDFTDTLDVLERVRFSGAFTFIYSKRSGTPAAKLPQLDEKLVSKRFERLLEVQNRITHEENSLYDGMTVRVLVDEASAKGDSILTGRTDGGTLVHFKGDSAIIGEFADVRITKNKTFFLEGEI